jgi:NAD(P)-dependent dehydrogenase (short-subunit alcohol dehydrogenase family)
MNGFLKQGNKMKLENKTVLITGANQGLGEQIAKKFAEEGASLILCARDKKLLNCVKNNLKCLNKNQKILIQRTDVSKLKDVLILKKIVFKNFEKLDCIINNAAIHGPIGELEKNDPVKWKQTLETNLMGAFYMCHAFVEYFKNRKHGKIINLSGGGAAGVRPYFSAYAVSKIGLVKLTEILADELKDYNVFVNAIAPGVMPTRLIGEMANCSIEKVCNEGKKILDDLKNKKDSVYEKAVSLALFLASDESNGITGKLISAQWDNWKEFPSQIDELKKSDLYTLRRVVSK